MPIPQQVKATVGLANSERYTGEIEMIDLPRLQPELAAPSEPLQVQLDFQQNRQGQWLRGSIRGALMLQCQRCFTPYAWPANLRLELLLVNNDVDEQRALEFADPYRIDDDKLMLRELVEDEVLLALPIVPRCQECENAVSAEPAPVEAEAAASKQTTNPFANLKNDLTGAAGPRRK